MKVLHAWLQNFIKEKLPSAESLAEKFTFHACEVEEVIGTGDAAVLDLKILPDRAHYALSHQGTAREIAAITGLTLKHHIFEEVTPTLSRTLDIVNEEPTLCRRYMSRRVNNVTVGASPDFFKFSLEAIGQRSINNLVDATNIVMFDVGQPMHMFDADKVVGGLIIRTADAGEKITTLDGKHLELEESMLVIADEAGPLAIAGVKGGARAAVTEETKNINIEAANFDPVSVRKTSTKIGIRNDSSKRFENEISPRLAEEGMQQISYIIKQFCPDAEFGDIGDIYQSPVKPWTVIVTTEYISKLLGITLSNQEIESILRRMDIHVTEQDNALVLEIPYYRLDLTIPADIAEEVGRVYGYEKIKAVALPTPEKISINKNFYWTQKVKDILTELGYSEVFTYSLKDHGQVEIQNPLASDKGYLRENLREGIEDALTFNARNAALLGLEEINIFELGNVFGKDMEETASLSIGYYTTKSVKNKPKVSWETMERLVKTLNEKLGVELQGIIESTDAGIIFECNFSSLIEKLPEPTDGYSTAPTQAIIYKQFSPYPFITRDIAVFVPEGSSEQDALNIIVKEAGQLLVKHSLFDVFQKSFPDGSKKTSYAFRLVFQSHDRTLTDEEINPIMQKITDTMNGKSGWQVR
jgi:phenylalanyl-tRNA synthetase beta chain